MTGPGDAGDWAGLTYGATERLLAELEETTPEAIRTRFRKLRLRPFPDEIRSGTGIHVRYDLPRLLALAGVFELNRLLLPQGRAADIVEASWPEWCRACIAAACRLGALPAPALMPDNASTLLVMRPDAYGDDGDKGIALAICGVGGASAGADAAPMVSIDATRTVAAVVSAAGEKAAEELSNSFRSLERAFGWTPPDLPHRSSVSEMDVGRGFLDDGPYFHRAEALLNAPDAAFDLTTSPLAHARLQWLLSYVEDPAPVDRWKAEIGEDEHRPRLKHLVNAWAVGRGLAVSVRYPPSKAVTAGSDPGALALRLIRDARRV